MKLFVIIFSLSYATATPRYDGRIIGGQDIPIEEVPYQVSLRDSGQHQCGGSIIAPNYIVTAAHCTYFFSEETLSIRAGSSNRESGGQIINVKKIHNHPDFDLSSSVDNDIAVLELANDLVFGDKVATIALPSPNQSWPAGTEVLVSGWGLTSDTNISSLPVNLQGITVEIVDRETCNSDYDGAVTERMLCAGTDEDGQGPCSADSGGPLQADGTLVGVVSWSNGCALRAYPTVYADVGMFLDFIQGVTGL